MLISIVIPIYNAEKDIPHCLNSILEQEYPSFEIILINDGSSDNSGKICDEYAQKDSRIKVFHKPNGGVSSARNLGINNARGEWITFIDADDYIEQNFFCSIPQYDYSLIITNWKPTSSDDYIEYLSPNEITNQKQINQFINNNLQLDILRCPWAKFFKRSIITDNNILFDERFKIGEDTLFVMSYLSYCKKILIKDGGAYRYYQRPSEESNYKYQLEFNKSIEYLETLCKKYKRLKCDNKNFLNLLYHFYRGKTKNINNPNIAKKWLHHPVIVHMLWLTYYKDNYKKYIYFIKLWIQSFITQSKEELI